MVNLDLSPKVHNVTKPASNAGEKEANLLLSSGIFVMIHVHYRLTGKLQALLWGFFFFGHFVGLANISVFWEARRVREKTSCCPWSWSR